MRLNSHLRTGLTANMKRSQFLLLLFPALLAILFSFNSFYFSWKLHSISVDEVINYQRVKEKMPSAQSISTIDKRLIISEMRNNGEYTRMESELLSDFGFMLIGLSFIIVTLTFRIRKQLECPFLEKTECPIGAAVSTGRFHLSHTAGRNGLMSEKPKVQGKLRKAAEAKLTYAPDVKQMPLVEQPEQQPAVSRL